jgi:uncharacterized protein YceH (UPF0502 family)
VEADPVQIRVVGCLIEKQRTTPGQYPLSLNALRLACNQATNRDPVVEYDESTIRSALDGLSRIGWTRLATGPGSRVARFRHLLDEALTLTPSQLAILTVLMLRGPQTVGELRTPSERLYPFPGVEEVERTLTDLAERELVQRLQRRPGQKEDRFTHLLGGEDASPAPSGEEADAAADPEPPADRLTELEERVGALAAEVESLRDEVRAIRGASARPRLT